jgi:ubiquinone/menaquinone biosynthesis C-methylase UbiE
VTAEESNSDSGDSPPSDSRDPARVRAVYDEIATHFAKTRAYPWPEVETFLDDYSDIAVALDIGCGNGRHSALLAEIAETVLALDVSRELLFEASERMARDDWTAELLCGDAASLPIEGNSVELAIYVATLHHLPDREHRIQSLSEIARVLTPGGNALVSTWSTAHDRFEDSDEGFDTMVDWTLPGGETVERFYHIYAPPEFEADLDASDLSVVETYVSSGNCYAEVRC